PSELTTPKLRIPLVASAAAGRKMVVTETKRPRLHPLRRAAPSIAAKARIGAGSIEYWKWNDHRLLDDDQNRSRKLGIAISRSGESSGSRSQFASVPSPTRSFCTGVASSSRLLIGCSSRYRTALEGPLPSPWQVQCR